MTLMNVIPSGIVTCFWENEVCDNFFPDGEQEIYEETEGGCVLSIV